MISSMAKSGSDSSAAAAAVDKEKLRELLSQIFNYVTKQCDENEDKVSSQSLHLRMHERAGEQSHNINLI